MRQSKRAKASVGEDGVDIISNMSDHILHLILSRIPTTEEVIRTSILSTRWRYLWTSISSIDIEYARGWNPTEEFKRDKFKDFVYWVLLNKPLHLDSFRLWCADFFDMSTIRHWIHAVVMRKVKLLDLMFSSIDEFFVELPQCLVTCGSLEELKLCLMGHPLSLPKVTGFPALRVLELNTVNLYNNKLVKYFLENCPLLEDLSLIDCVIYRLKVLCISCLKLKSLRLDNRNIADFREMYNIDNACDCIKIVCPELVYFEFGAFKADTYEFKSLGSLKIAAIHPEEFPFGFSSFARIFYLESLSTSIDVLCYALWPPVEPPSQPNIKTLKLTTGLYSPTPVISDLISFLTVLTHLESLHLIIEEDFFDWEDWKLDEAETRSILTCHLKRVEFLNFHKQKLILDVARALLEHGDVLEEMVFRWDCDEAEFHERSMETMKEVAKFHKASSTVRLITINEISYYQLSGKPISCAY